MSEAKAGYIPPAAEQPNVKSGSDKNSSNTKPMNADSIKQAKNYPCAAKLL